MDEHLLCITGVGDTIPFAEILSFQRRRNADDDICQSNLESDLLSVKASGRIILCVDALRIRYSPRYGISTIRDMILVLWVRHSQSMVAP